MDSRNGKRPFSSDEPKAKEEDDHIDQDESLFLAYSDRSRQDMSAIVSVLSQVLGSTGKNQSSLDSVIDSSATVSANLQSTAPAPVRQNQSQVIKGKEDPGQKIRHYRGVRQRPWGKCTRSSESSPSLARNLRHSRGCSYCIRQRGTQIQGKQSDTQFSRKGSSQIRIQIRYIQ